jgi:hypothetical protein
VSFFFFVDSEGSSAPAGVEVVAVQGGATLLGTNTDASPPGLLASSLDAGGGPTQSRDAGDEPGAMATTASDARTPESEVDAPRNTKENDRIPKVAKKAKLTIRVRPWASISIDGKNYGQTPQTIELNRGKHRIVLTNVGIDRVERLTVTLKAAQVKSIDKDWN